MASADYVEVPIRLDARLGQKVALIADCTGVPADQVASVIFAMSMLKRFPELMGDEVTQSGDDLSLELGPIPALNGGPA